jgi:hypothetical protein
MASNEKDPFRNSQVEISSNNDSDEQNTPKASINNSINGNKAFFTL